MSEGTRDGLWWIGGVLFVSLPLVLWVLPSGAWWPLLAVAIGWAVGATASYFDARRRGHLRVWR